MNCRVLLALLCTLVISGESLAHAADLSPQAIVDAAQALRSKNISSTQRQEGLKTLRESYEKFTHLSFRQAQKYSEADIAKAKFEIEQLEVFMTLEKCKSNRNLSQSIAVGSSGYNPCQEGQQQPYEPGNQNLWDLNRTIKQVSGLSPELVEKDLFRKRAYHRAVTDAVKNLIVLEIEESEVRWTSDQIQNRVSLIVKENCKNCTVLDTRLITGHVTRSIVADLKSGAVKPQSLLAQTENICSLLKNNNYDFYPVSMRASASAYISPIGQGRNDINVHLRKRIEALRTTIQSGREALLILTHAMTDLSGGELAHVKLKCLKVEHKIKEDQSHNISVMKGAYAEAESNVKKFLDKLKQDLHMKDPIKSEIDSDIEMLTKLAPRAIGEALYEQSDQATSICQVIQRIQKDDEFDETLDEVKIWGSVVVGTGLMLTGVFAPAGATVMGASLSMSALVTGVGLNVGVGLHDAYMSSVVKEDSELLRSAAFASGNDPNLYRVSQEEWSRFEGLRVSAMLNLGLSSVDVATLAMPILKAGKGFKSVNQALEKALVEKTIATKEVKAVAQETKAVTQEIKIQEAAWRAKESGDLNQFKKLETEVKERLATEKVKSIEPLTGKVQRSAKSYQVELESGMKGIFKPDTPANPTRYELVVSEADEMLGLGVVPKKVERTINGTRGSMQYWVEGAKEYSPVEYQKLINKGKTPKDDRIALLDYLFQNADAGPHNILIKENGEQIAIDHGMLYFKGRKPGGGEFYTDDVAEILKNQEVRKALRELDFAQFESTISRHLTPQETASVMKRVKALKEKVIGAKGKLVEPFTVDESIPNKLENSLNNKPQEAAWSAKERGDIEEYKALDAELEKRLKTDKILEDKTKRINGQVAPNNYVQLVTFEDGTRAIFKRMGPTNNYIHEIAIAKLDRELGLGIVPQTVEREVDGVKGSLQYYVDGGTHLVPSTINKIRVRDPVRPHVSDKINFLDYMFGLRDRHIGNFLVMEDGRQIAIDNAAAFDTYNDVPYRDLMGKWYKDPDVRHAIERWNTERVTKILQEAGVPKDRIKGIMLKKDKVVAEFKKLKTAEDLPSTSNLSSGNSAELIAKDPYPGVTLEKALAADAEVKTKLEELGVKYRKLPVQDRHTESNLTNEMKSSEKIKLQGLDQNEILDLKRSTALYQITRRDLPVAKGARQVTEKALLHPDLPEIMQELESCGYRLVVDSSLPASRIGAYYSPSKNLIALRPDSNWSTFMHEYQHFEFDQLIKHLRTRVSYDSGTELQDLSWKAVMAESKNHTEFFKQFPKDHQKLQEIMDLYSKTNLTELGVNETLSVRREIELLEKEGYTRLSSKYVHARKYALDHQINEIKKLNKEFHLTDLQKQTLFNARAEKALLIALEHTKAYSNGLLTGASLASAPFIPLMVVDEKQRVYFIQQGKEFVVFSIDKLSRLFKK